MIETSVQAGRSAAVAGALWIAAGVVYVGGEAIAASAFPGYSYATNYISDLGVPEVAPFQGRMIDSPLHLVMNSAFVLQGLLFIAAAIASVAGLRSLVRGRGGRVVFLVFAAIHAVGITLVGLIHGGPVNAASGLDAFHVLGAGMAIIGGNLTAVTAGIIVRNLRRTPGTRAYATASIALGIVGIAALAMLRIDSADVDLALLPDGIWERISVYTVTGWELLTGAVLLLALRRARAGAAQPS